MWHTKCSCCIAMSWWEITSLKSSPSPQFITRRWSDEPPSSLIFEYGVIFCESPSGIQSWHMVLNSLTSLLAVKATSIWTAYLIMLLIFFPTDSLLFLWLFYVYRFWSWSMTLSLLVCLDNRTISNKTSRKYNRSRRRFVPRLLISVNQILSKEKHIIFIKFQIWYNINQFGTVSNFAPRRFQYWFTRDKVMPQHSFDH